MLSAGVLAASCLLLTPGVYASVVQKPLAAAAQLELEAAVSAPARKLTGRFLHITDIHPDPYYSYYSSTASGVACHRGSGPSGYYGAETSDCDSPLSLVNATFRWIEKNLADKIDFVIWTGDSARHDNDEEHPRNKEQVLAQNQLLVDHFVELFGDRKNGDAGGLSIPIVPSFGNNDVLPHNLFFKGPNEWTSAYSDVWRPFIPEEQRHGFDRGGWFFREVIPGKLAVFSLNTMYFFDSNNAVDGCASPSEPGYEHFEWLRTQLQFLRERGVKAIMSGHVPPARNDEKVGWDETCWQKYALWMQQYRDVVVGSVYGHMNIEHFVLQEFSDIDIGLLNGEAQTEEIEAVDEGEISIELNPPDYLNALRDLWSKIPSAPEGVSFDGTSTDSEDVHMDKKKEKKKKKKKSAEQKFYDKIGGRFAEGFAVSYISASVVPNFYSSLRVFDYNITGLEDTALDAAAAARVPAPPSWRERVDDSEEGTGQETDRGRSVWDFSWLPHARGSRLVASDLTDYFGPLNPFKKHKKHKHKKQKKPNFTVPDPPSKHSSPGPAYSPQTFSLTAYTQYFANNTYLNNDGLAASSSPTPGDAQRGDGLRAEGWNPGKHEDERPGESKKKPDPRPLVFEIEYDTRDAEDAYGMSNGVMTVRKWVELAARIGEYKGKKNDEKSEESAETDGESTPDDDEEQHDSPTSLPDNSKTEPATDAAGHPDTGKRKKGRHHKERKRRREIVNASWYAFVSRAVVATMGAEELRERFGEEY